MRRSFLIVEVTQLENREAPRLTVGKWYMADYVNDKPFHKPHISVLVDDKNGQSKLQETECRVVGMLKVKELKPSKPVEVEHVCKECKKPNSILHDYNGHGHWVCIGCLETLEKEFEEEYR